MQVPSLPPVAQREPSGAMVRALTYPVCPTRLVWILNNFVRVHTLTILSQPADTTIGLRGLGENLTQETQSECASSIEHLHSPKVFHNLILLSLDPETICLLSGEKKQQIKHLLYVQQINEK